MKSFSRDSIIQVTQEWNRMKEESDITVLDQPSRSTCQPQFQQEDNQK